MSQSAGNRVDRSRAGAGGGPAPAVAAGLLAAVVGALLWALIVDLSGYKVGFVAVGIGVLVGQAIAVTRGSSRWLPVAGALFGLVGCLLGDALVDAHEVAAITGLSTRAVLSYLVHSPGAAADVFRAGFSPLDLLFWAIAAGAGYRLAAASLPSPPPAAPAPEPVRGPVAQHPSDFFSPSGTLARNPQQQTNGPAGTVRPATLPPLPATRAF